MNFETEFQGWATIFNCIISPFSNKYQDYIKKELQLKSYDAISPRQFKRPSFIRMGTKNSMMFNNLKRKMTIRMSPKATKIPILSSPMIKEEENDPLNAESVKKIMKMLAMLGNDQIKSR